MNTGNNHSDDSLSTLHHALRTPRRRQVVSLVHEATDPPTTIRELARAIAAKEEGTHHEQATGEPYRNAYNALSQTHLPTLADAGIIIYDSDRQTILPGENLTIAAVMVAMAPPILQVLTPEVAGIQESTSITD